MNDYTQQIIGAAIEVHRHLGPGLLESSYEQCLAHEMSLREVPFRTQVSLPLEYKGMKLDCGYRVDFIVGDETVAELKAVDAILPIHEAQLLTYLRLSGCRVGLLLNFNVPVMKDGVKRMVLDFPDDS